MQVYVCVCMCVISLSDPKLAQRCTLVVYIYRVCVCNYLVSYPKICTSDLQYLLLDAAAFPPHSLPKRPALTTTHPQSPGAFFTMSQGS